MGPARLAAVFALVALGACSSSAKETPKAVPLDAEAAAAAAAAPRLPAHRVAPDLAGAIRELVTDDVRVVAFGELHERVDRPTGARSSLARFTEDVLPVLSPRASDLVLETWLVDRRCGQEAAAATAQVEATMQRPPATKSELAVLVDRARAAQIQPHAMRLTCDDWATIAPPGREIDYEAMLAAITRELGRIGSEAATARPPERLIAIYGGALHNDLYPIEGIADWSFAAALDAATGGTYLEIDLYVPQNAAADTLSQGQPWFPLLDKAGPDHVVVIERGARSYIVLLPLE